MPEDYRRFRYDVIDTAEASAWAAILEEQRLAIERSGQSNRPWMYWELHNPWSRSAAVVDSWALLDICQSAALLGLLAGRIGEDIVLFDSQIMPIPALGQPDVPGWTSDTDFFPLEGATGDQGIVVRIPFGSPHAHSIEHVGHPSARVEYGPGQLLLHSTDFEYRRREDRPVNQWEYVIRYYSATRHYDRDPAHAKQFRLMERYPWVNYSKMPHWLVSGKDRADNDFVTGFLTKPGHWSAANLAMPSAADD